MRTALKPLGFPMAKKFSYGQKRKSIARWRGLPSRRKQKPENLPRDLPGRSSPPDLHTVADARGGSEVATKDHRLAELSSFRIWCPGPSAHYDDTAARCFASARSSWSPGPDRRIEEA